MYKDIERKVIEIAKSKGKVCNEINNDTDLELILNSITYIQFLIACEDEFDIEIDDAQLDMGNMRTLKDVALYIQKVSSEN